MGWNGVLVFCIRCGCGLPVVLQGERLESERSRLGGPMLCRGRRRFVKGQKSSSQIGINIDTALDSMAVNVLQVSSSSHITV
jgi:hypothetical protein